MMIGFLLYYFIFNYIKTKYPVVPVVPLLLTQASFLKVTTLNNENTKIVTIRSIFIIR